MQYKEFIDEINAGRIAKAVLCVQGYAHYKDVVFSCNPCHFAPYGVEIFVRPVADGTEDMVFYHRYDETSPLVRIKGRGQLTLKQIWQEVSVKEIVYHEPLPVEIGTPAIDLVIGNIDYSYEWPAVLDVPLSRQLSIHGDLRIEISGQLYLEQTICPIELCVQYKEWATQLRRGRALDFVYVSAQNPQGEPLFSFKKCEESWRITSPCELFQASQLFSFAQIDQAFRGLLRQLEEGAISMD